MELSEYLTIMRKRWISVSAVALISLALAAVFTLLSTSLYTASTRMFFSVQGGDSITDLTQGSTFTEKQMSSYAEVATSPLVLDAVIEQLRLPTSAGDLASRVSVTVPDGTVILEVGARDESSSTAAAIANAVAGQLSTAVSELSPDRPDGSEPVRATVLTPAVAPESPSSPKPSLNLLLGLLLGLMFGIGFAIIRETLDTKVRGERDVAALTASSVLGNVAFVESATQHPVFMHDDPLSPRAEAIRRLRTNLQFVNLTEARKSIIVTSSLPGEGKSTTTINLALSLADAGARVVLVDADLRRPSVAEYLGLEGRVGLTTVLIGRANVVDVVQRWRQTSLDILPSGQVPPNPSELLGSRAMTTLLGQLTSSYDIVLIDTPPLLPVTDAAILSKVTGGTLVVAGADRIHKAQLQESLQSLDTVGARVLGIVLNKVQRNEKGKYSYEAYAQDGPVALGAPLSKKARATWPGRPLANRNV